MAADALAPCVTMSWVAMIFAMTDKWVLAFHEEEFQIAAPSQFWEITENANIFLCFVK